MKPFSKQEIYVVVSIFLAVFVISFFNFRLALRRARDSQRRSDVSYVANTLYEFYEDTGYLPLSSDDGKIKICEPENHAEFLDALENKEISNYQYLEKLLPCDWGEDGLTDLRDNKNYITSLPLDPKHKDGFSYKYISNGRFFQLYAYMEGGSDEEGFQQSIVERSLNCGDNICSYGKSFDGDKTPLDKSLEEYENELREQK